MIDSLLEIINDMWPLLAALYAGLHGLITWLFRKNKKDDSDPAELEESTENRQSIEAAEREPQQPAEDVMPLPKEIAIQDRQPAPEQKPAPTPKKQPPARVKPSEPCEPTPKPAIKTPHPPLTAQNIRQAIVVSEILGKPKSLRRD